MVKWILDALGLGKIQLIVIAAAVVAAGTVIGMLYWQNSSLKTENKNLIGNNAKMTVALNEQSQTIKAAKDAIDEWKTQMKQVEHTMSQLAQEQATASAETRRLNDVFAKHDLERLSLAKPGLIEHRINSGTADVLGMFEHATAERADGAGGNQPSGSQ